eukprot:594032-Rhodomonas_salina.1
MPKPGKHAIVFRFYWVRGYQGIPAAANGTMVLRLANPSDRVPWPPLVVVLISTPLVLVRERGAGSRTSQIGPPPGVQFFSRPQPLAACRCRH